MTTSTGIQPAVATPGPGSRKQLDLEGLRAQLAGRGGEAYWRSLEELSGTEEFRQLLEREFPENASEWQDGVSRRNFLKLMGASLAFGGLSGCTIQPEEKIVPWVRAPENVLPGRPLMYATAASVSGVGVGVLAETHMGRPTLLEGNGDHPSGAVGAHPSVQASILGLYDPDRSQTVKNAGRISTWGGFVEALSGELEMQRSRRGRGLRVLTGSVTSPTLGAQLRDLLLQMPEARWHQYDPCRGDGVLQGSRQAFGESLGTSYDMSRADVVLSLDADIFFQGAASTRYAADFMKRRTEGLHGDGTSVSNRLYVVESSPSSTGSVADHRLALDTGSIEAFAAALAARLGIEARYEGGTPVFEDRTGWVEAVATDLEAHRGAGVVIAGPEQSAALHALAHAINHALGNAGRTVHHTDPVDAEAVDHCDSLAELTRQMEAGEVESLVILGGNPVYDAPGDLDFAAALEAVPFRAHLGPYEDETAYLCHWHVPESHFLEAWSDVRCYDGTVSIVQPLIKPLYPSRSAHEVLAVMTGKSGKPVRDLLREHWAASPVFEGRDFEHEWQRALHDGSIAGSALPRREVSLLGELRLPGEFGRRLDPEEGLELSLRADPFLGAGAQANNGWLQETPKPITQLTWDNAALLSPATAQRLGVDNEQVLTITVEGRSLSLPAWIVPGQAPGVVTVHLGGGRRRGGRVADGTGGDAGPLRTAADPWSTTRVVIARTFDRRSLACTQDHQAMEGRGLVRRGDLDHYRESPHFAHEDYGHQIPEDLTLYDEFDYKAPNQWGMVIDLTACMGCNACSVACQAENNIPVVGREQVLNAREMSWIRIDRYYTDLDDPDILHQPIPCQQCENAPCELVCPVTATSHSEEGLNDMVYNRCVGTRYCANNCPYKVRRFNFLQYADRETETSKMVRNPDVTVRARGVMEKCTYCVQRINSARVEAKKENGEGRVGGDEVRTACQQACPTGAIAFGNLTDDESEVSRLKRSPLNYGILTELNTRPRTTYLARVRNPNPRIG